MTLEVINQILITKSNVKFHSVPLTPVTQGKGCRPSWFCNTDNLNYGPFVLWLGFGQGKVVVTVQCDRASWKVSHGKRHVVLSGAPHLSELQVGPGIEPGSSPRCSVLGGHRNRTSAFWWKLNHSFACNRVVV